MTNDLIISLHSIYLGLTGRECKCSSVNKSYTFSLSVKSWLQKLQDIFIINHSLIPMQSVESRAMIWGTVSSRGCSKAFILCVLHRALEYVKFLSFGATYPFPQNIVHEWLILANRDCRAGAFLNHFGGTEFDANDPATFWIGTQQFYTWWKNNIERRNKFQSLKRDAQYTGLEEKHQKRASFCQNVVSLAVNIRNHFEKHRVGGTDVFQVPIPTPCPLLCPPEYLYRSFPDSPMDSIHTSCPKVSKRKNPYSSCNSNSFQPSMDGHLREDSVSSSSTSSSSMCKKRRGSGGSSIMREGVHNNWTNTADPLHHPSSRSTTAASSSYPVDVVSWDLHEGQFPSPSSSSSASTSSSSQHSSSSFGSDMCDPGHVVQTTELRCNCNKSSSPMSMSMSGTRPRPGSVQLSHHCMPLATGSLLPGIANGKQGTATYQHHQRYNYLKSSPLDVYSLATTGTGIGIGIGDKDSTADLSLSDCDFDFDFDALSEHGGGCEGSEVDRGDFMEGDHNILYERNDDGSAREGEGEGGIMTSHYQTLPEKSTSGIRLMHDRGSSLDSSVGEEISTTQMENLIFLRIFDYDGDDSEEVSYDNNGLGLLNGEGAHFTQLKCWEV
eukprot:gene106-148_t